MNLGFPETENGGGGGGGRGEPKTTNLWYQNVCNGAISNHVPETTTRKAKHVQHNKNKNKKAFRESAFNSSL